MKPYYEHAGITIYHGDCREILPQLPPVDLVLTDPPYGIGKDYGNNSDNQFDGSWFPLAKERAAGVAFTPGIINMFLYPKPSWVLCWFKPGAVSRTRYGFNSWEPILIYDLPPSTREPDVIRIEVGIQNEVGDHPTPKPLKLFSRLLDRFTEAHSIIADPFMGSGTTLRAAKDLGRKAIGIEIHEPYCEIAAKRLQQEVFDFKD